MMGAPFTGKELDWEGLETVSCTSDDERHAIKLLTELEAGDEGIDLTTPSPPPGYEEFIAREKQRREEALAAQDPAQMSDADAEGEIEDMDMDAEGEEDLNHAQSTETEEQRSYDGNTTSNSGDAAHAGPHGKKRRRASDWGTDSGRSKSRSRSRTWSPPPPRPETIDDMTPEQLQILYERYRVLATAHKRLADKGYSPALEAGDMAEVERLVTLQTDSLLLYTFAFVCSDLSQGSKPQHARNWRSMTDLVEFVKKRAQRHGFEVQYGLCCFAEAFMNQKVSDHERTQFLRAHQRGSSASTPGSSGSPAEPALQHHLASLLSIAQSQDRVQKAWLAGNQTLSTAFMRDKLPRTLGICDHMLSRTAGSSIYLPHSPHWTFCWPLNLWDGAADVCSWGRSCLEEWAGERLGVNLESVDLTF